MYNNSRYRQRTSIRHNGFSNGFSRSPQRGSFARPGFSANKRGGGQRRSQLEGADINMFIRKAAQNAPDESQTESHTFDSFNLHENIRQNISALGYINPTPVQAQAIGPILEGRDVIGLASTGTGKTAAFLIPLIQKIYLNRDQKALIIVPTRELALQINEEFKNLTRNMKLFSAFIIGGTNMYRQIQDLRRNPHIVIATPGRLKDLIERKNIYMEDYSNIVLDEVDLMVDIGFINDIKFFVSRMPKVRQSLFFSATISPKIQDVLRYFVTNPVTVSVKTQDTSENVEQDVVKIPRGKDKVEVLHELLNQKEFNKVLVFSRTKHGTEKLAKLLAGKGFRVESIHGNKTQSNRKRALTAFKEGRVQVLVATDVAARGLDIPDVSHVINFDIPATYDDYVHRIGRTGRGNKFGKALTFIS